jgi:hypothetical protein
MKNLGQWQWMGGVGGCSGGMKPVPIERRDQGGENGIKMSVAVAVLTEIGTQEKHPIFFSEN